MTVDLLGAEPTVHFEAEVLAVAPLGESLVRVTFGGPGMRDVTTCGPGQRVKIFLSREPGADPRVPTGEDWYRRYREIPESDRPYMRTYTIRAARPGEIDVDFVRHGDSGPATRWAAAVKPGDRVVVYGPNARFEDDGDPARRGADYGAPADASWQLIAGDETALPAIGGIVESLAPGQRAYVFAEVPVAADRQEWQTDGDVTVTWLPRDGAPAGTSAALLAAVREAELPAEPGYAWLAGEARQVRDLRRHLVGERGMDRKRIDFCGYWRYGKSEDAPFEPEPRD
ncbi:siderophore-interacting protein [Amycolatopsis sp. A1MSW2902]|uniref:siderophore-interacting protein n=1 Tax=Amycolatopsis sp. A1MSW2902 TaxID=687413 RepID=UPI00307DF7A3